MARFKRDEQRTYPIWWLIAGGLFIFSTFWACYAEFVTRVPWQKEQEAFYQMEFEQATRALKRTKNEFAANVEPELKKVTGRRDELKHEQATGKYAGAKTKLTQLSRDYAEAEQGKTFGKSDLDEAYYYRELAEYERDAAEEAARKQLENADLAGGRKRADEMLADPPPLSAQPNVSLEMLHLKEEIARNTKRADQIDEALGGLPGKAQEAWEKARDSERKVVDKVRVEVEHQKRVDKAVNEMIRIDGPGDPASNEKDEKLQVKLRADACAAPGARETRHCIQWLDLDPVDSELAALERAIAKAERPVEDAKLRLTKADEKAHPRLNPSNLIASLVGPYQIQQVVTHWQDAEADVEREAVDRCMTCHMGADSGNYADSALPRQFRTHPFRKTLFTSHPVEKFGCTSCHQGQGRATDALAHSRTVFAETSVTGPRWTLEGDKFWEDLLYPVGQLHHVAIDAENDSFQIKIGSGGWKDIELPKKSPATVHEMETERGGKALSKKDYRKFVDYRDEAELFGKLQELVQSALEKDDTKTWHAVARKTDNRVELGIEQNDPAEVIDPKQRPKVKLKFPKPGLAELLGFPGASDLDKGVQLYVAPEPPSLPVRSEAGESWDKNGRYTPPTGSFKRFPSSRAAASGATGAMWISAPTRRRPNSSSPSSSAKRPRSRRKRTLRVTPKRTKGPTSYPRCFPIPPTRSIRCRSSPRGATCSRSSTAPAVTSSTGSPAIATRAPSSTTSPPRCLRIGCSSGCATRAPGDTRRACRTFGRRPSIPRRSSPTPNRLPSTRSGKPT
jgi:hypothetical protein